MYFLNSFSVGVLYYGIVLMTTQVFQQVRPGESLCSAGAYLLYLEKIPFCVCGGWEAFQHARYWPF